MEKITKKLIITLLISFLFLIIVHNNEVNAHSTEDIIEEIDIEATLASITEDEKIMEYNAITGKTARWILWRTNTKDIRQLCCSYTYS